MFADRREAGRLLAHQLVHLRGRRTVVLALPRGGVPVGFEVASALEAPLDVLLVARIPAPDRGGVGVGAVVEGEPPEIVVREDMAAALNVAEGHIADEGRRLGRRLERLRRAYTEDLERPDISDATVVLVDDGIATGTTVEAALHGLRRAGARRIVLAVPVIPLEVARRLQAEVDAVICLATPAQSQGVGIYYRDFEPVSDEEVRALLRRARSGDARPAGDITPSGP